MSLRSTAPSESLLQPFYPALNGLRAVAFLSVFGRHYCQGASTVFVFRWGWIGVDIFFVLSGFLITGILVDSLEHAHYFRDFYIKRALRIFPLFFGFWLLLFLLTPLFHFGWNAYNLTSFAYLGNFFAPGAEMGRHLPSFTIPIGHASFHGIPVVISIGHFWSLCVEEQFYLIWPLVVWLVRKRTSLLRICLFVIAVSPLLRAAYYYLYPLRAIHDGIFMNTFLRADTLLVGAALALWLRGAAPSPRLIRRGASITVCAAPVLFAIGYSLQHQHALDPRRDFFVATIGYSLIAIAAGALLLLAIDTGTRIASLLQNKVLSHLGRISYGLYFYHYLPGAMLLTCAERLHRYHLAALVPLFALPCTVAIASLSFRYLESPFLEMKKILAPSRTPEIPVPSSAARPALWLLLRGKLSRA